MSIIDLYVLKGRYEEVVKLERMTVKLDPGKHVLLVDSILFRDNPELDMGLDSTIFFLDSQKRVIWLNKGVHGFESTSQIQEGVTLQVEVNANCEITNIIFPEQT